MRITLVAVGTRGDAQPYIALARGLLAAGHTVRVATHHEHEAFVRDHGLEFAAVTGHARAIMETGANAAMDVAGSPLRFTRQLNRVNAALTTRRFHDCLEACRDADLVIISVMAQFAAHVAEALGVPIAGAYLQPVTPTGAFPHAMFPGGRQLGRMGNRLSYVAAGQAFWLMQRTAINRARREVLGLPALGWAAPRPRGRRRGGPLLYGFSPSVVPKPRDWPCSVSVAGYWFLDRAREWQASAELEDFLAAGPPPVYIGFGSMERSNQHRDAQTDIVVKSLALTGQRGILYTGGIQSAIALPDSVYQVADVPHDWLFPRMSAVIHHGGAGTTAEGLRAGVPSVVVPFYGDQRFWARRVASLAVGPAPIPRSKLSVDRLAGAIRAVTGDAGLRRRAGELGRRIRGEDGVARAVEVLDIYERQQ